MSLPSILMLDEYIGMQHLNIISDLSANPQLDIKSDAQQCTQFHMQVLKVKQKKKDTLLVVIDNEIWS